MASGWFFWQADEDIVFLTVKKIVVDHRLQLLGFGVPGGLFFGPALYYLTSIFSLIAGMNPEIFSVQTALIGVFTTLLVYKIGSLIFEEASVGLLAATFYAFSNLIIDYSKVFTALAFAPMLSLFVYGIVYSNLKAKKPKYLVWLGLVLTFSLQNEGSSFSLVLLAIFVWIFYRFFVPFRKLLQILLIFFIFQIPLVLYELQNNFFLTKSSLLFFLKRETILKATSSSDYSNIQGLINLLQIFPQTISRILFISGEKNVTNQILSCPNLVAERYSAISLFAFIIAIVILGFFLMQSLFFKKSVLGTKIVSMHLLAMIVGMLIYSLFYPNHTNEWTTVIFFPGFCFIIAFFLYHFSKVGKLPKFLVILFVAAFVIFNLNTFFNTTENYGLSSKIKAVRFAISYVRDKPFYLESIGTCHKHGYLYLFWFLGKLPDQTYGTGAQFAPELIPEGSKIKPNLGVVMVHDLDKGIYEKYLSYKKKAVKNQEFDGVEVLIVEDK